MKKLRGFTMFELLIIIALVLILVTVASLSVIGIREKVRDSERLSDIESIEKTMGFLMAEQGSYLNACGENVQEKIVSTCVSAQENVLLDDFNQGIIYLNDPVEKKIACDSRCSKTPCNYAFEQVTENSFIINFYLEKGAKDYRAGCHKLTEQKIK